MAEIVNLRRARKRRERDERARQADENRILHGRPRAEREHREALSVLERRRLDGHRRDTDPSSETPE